MAPDPRLHLQALADALPADGMATVPVAWLRAVLAGNGAATSVPDLTCKQLAERWGRKPSTIRQWCHGGEIPGAYLWNRKEYRVPLAGVLAYEERVRQGVGPSGPNGDPDSADLGAWRKVRVS
jgi:hypothetical protein